ncbi:sialidase family protein [Fibrella sp. WM1]|uniref:sialidase family protein n=1 Tax=Fibrella musci TaxID=3242485 RepID=UPI003521F85D
MRLLLSIVTALLLASPAFCRPGNPLVADDTRAVALPVLTQLPAGNVLLSWTEKDPAGKLFLYTATSADKGKTFSEKNLVYADNGIGASRLMKPRVLAKPNGTLVAVFTLRTESAQPAAPAAPAENHAGMNHDNHQPAAAAPAAEKPRGRRAPATTQIVTCTSTDQGRTWTAPQPVDADKTPNLLRGFFDATVLSNGEIAIAYLKDVAGSTKHEERNLRLVVTQNGQFQPERIIDPVACDCCNISMLVDANGTLNIYYRDNNDDIRDISRLQSTDNGKTFSAPKNLYADNWKINGCPHSGPSSVRLGKSALVAWFSGTTNNTAGVRVVTQEGERLAVVEDPSAKNASLIEAPDAGVLVWEQVRGAGETPTTAIAYRVVNAKKAADMQWLAGSEQGQNASGLVVGDQLVVAYELRRPGKPNALQLGYASVK